jgi:uncharacterized protein (TIGR03437 family)
MGRQAVHRSVVRLKTLMPHHAKFSLILVLGPALWCSAQTPLSDAPKALFPNVTAVVNGASFLPGIASGGWATILGTDLATTTRPWTDLDFVNGNLPPNLSSTGVVVNGRAAFVGYVSPTQLNVLIADDPGLGMVTVLVTEAFNTSNIVFANKVALAPALFTFNDKYPVAAHNTDGTYAAPANLLMGVASTPAHPGEVIQLFGTGFGPTNPPIATGVLFATPAPLAQAMTATVAGVPAKVEGFLIYPGVYQLNLTVPVVSDGDAALAISMGSNSIQTGLVLAIAN